MLKGKYWNARKKHVKMCHPQKWEQKYPVLHLYELSERTR